MHTVITHYIYTNFIMFTATIQCVDIEYTYNIQTLYNKHVHNIHTICFNNAPIIQLIRARYNENMQSIYFDNNLIIH